MRYCIKRGINYYEHGTKFVRSIEIISLSIKYSGSVSTSLNFLFTSGKPRNSWREYRYTRIQSTYVPKCDRYYQPRERLCFWSSKGPAKTTRLFSKSSPPLSYHSCSKLVHAFHLPERDGRGIGMGDLGCVCSQSWFLSWRRFLHRWQPTCPL